MPGYSSEEVRAAVTRFLFTQVRVPRLKTGNRDVLALRTQVFDLLTTALLLRPDSYFYLIWLSKNRLRGLVQQQIEAMESIEADAPGITRRARRVESTADLTNAEAALLQLNAGLNSRTEGLAGAIGPAVDRFRRSIDRFSRTELAKNVVDGGAVVETGAELQRRVADTWAAALARQDELRERAELLAGAVSTLAAVRLPEQSVRDLVTRIRDRLQEIQSTMRGSEAVRQSREALLELRTMRTLLTRAASFSAPALVRAPRTGDATTGILVGSGDPPTLDGTVAAPFNYAANTLFTFEIGGSARSLYLPGDSRASLESRDVSGDLAGPTTPAILAVRFNGNVTRTATVGAGLSPPWASGADLAAELDVAFGADGTAEWDAASGAVRVYSNDTSDGSSVELLIDTTARENFVAWFLGGALFAEGRPVDARAVVDALHASHPDLEAEVHTEFSITGTARTGTPTTRLDTELVGGADLQIGGATAISPSQNLRARGVAAGMLLVVSAPAASAGTYLIEKVEGAVLTLDTPPGDAPSATYAIHPDYRSLPAGTRLKVTRPASAAGYFRVASTTDTAIHLDRGVGADEVDYVLDRRTLRLRTRSADAASSLGIPSATAGGTALGFPVQPAAVPSLGALQASGVDFIAREVRSGDALRLIAPSGYTHDATVTGVEPTRLMFDPPAPYEAGSWSYRATNARYAAYTALQSAAGAVDPPAGIDAQVARLIQGARYSVSIQTDVQAYLATLRALRDALDAYTVPKEPAVDGIVQTLREQGMDRALDLLLRLDLVAFFGMDPDEVSYSTRLTRQAATAAREVTPVSRFAKSEQVEQEWRPLAFQPDPFDPLGE